MNTRKSPRIAAATAASCAAIVTVFAIACPAALAAEPQQTPATSAPAVTTSPSYRLAGGDVIRVAVLNKPEFSGDFTIESDGSLRYPYAGEVRAAGMTLAELTDRIRTALAKQIARPQVTLQIAQKHTNYVSVLGAVNTPGKRPLGENWRLLDLLADCGLNVGRPEWAKATLVRRRGDETEAIPVDLPSLLAGGDTGLNLPLQPGDLLLVEQKDVAKTHIQVMGAVAKPGAVAAVGETRLQDVLNAAGGVAPNAALAQAKIERGGETIPLDLSGLSTPGTPIPDVKLLPGDRLDIPVNPAEYAVVGAVATPGKQVYPEKEQLTVLGALFRAGGAGSSADLKKATLMRRPTVAGGQPQMEPIDLDQMLKKSRERGKGGEKLSGDIVMQPGDVLWVPAKGESRGGGNAFQNIMNALPIFGWFVR